MRARAADNLAVAALAAALAYNYTRSLKHQPTICARTRALFHTNTKLGRFVFAAALAAGATALHNHVINGDNR